MVRVCSNLTVTAEFMAEIETVKKEISLKDEIQKIKADKDKKLQTKADLYDKSKEEELKLEEEKEKQEQQTRIRVKSAIEELHERIFKLEKEREHAGSENEADIGGTKLKLGVIKEAGEGIQEIAQRVIQPLQSDAAQEEQKKEMWIKHTLAVKEEAHTYHTIREFLEKGYTDWIRRGFPQ